MISSILTALLSVVSCFGFTGSRSMQDNTWVENNQPVSTVRYIKVDAAGRTILLRQDAAKCICRNQQLSELCNRHNLVVLANENHKVKNNVAVAKKGRAKKAGQELYTSPLVLGETPFTMN